MRVLVRWALAVGLAIVAAPRLAHAQLQIEGNGAFNVGYSHVTQSVVAVDPTGDVPESSSDRLYTELRPSISVQMGSPRLSWRAGYMFSGMFGIGAESATYANQADGTLIAQLTKSLTATVTAAGAQGGTAFLMSQRAADAGQAELRAPGNEDRVTASVGESIVWDAGRRTQLLHGLTAMMNAPEAAMSEYNGTLAGSVALERLFPRDTVGLEVRTAVSRLRPLELAIEPYASLSNTTLVRWNHDLSRQWNFAMSAGIEQVYVDTKSKPLALVPNTSVAVLATVGRVNGVVEATHGSLTNLQVGTISISDRISARGNVVLDERAARTLAFSAGILHDEPLGEAATMIAAGIGNALQLDVGFATGIKRNVLLTARYSAAYQFGQPGNVAPSLAHTVLVGVTAAYGNSEQVRRPLPTRGRRVDGSDGVAAEPSVVETAE